MTTRYTAVTHFTMQCQTEIEVREDGYEVSLRETTLKRSEGNTTVFVKEGQPDPDDRVLVSANQIIPKAMLLKMAQVVAGQLSDEQVEQVAPKLAKESLN